MKPESPQKPIIEGLVERIQGRGNPDDERQLHKSIGSLWGTRILSLAVGMLIAGIISLILAFSFWSFSLMIKALKLLVVGA